MVILVIAIIALIVWALIVFVNRYEEKKEKVFTDILNGDTALNLFNTGKYEEYAVTFKNKKGQEEIYPVWANSEQQAKVIFSEETGESYLRIIKITH